MDAESIREQVQKMKNLIVSNKKLIILAIAILPTCIGLILLGTYVPKVIKQDLQKKEINYTDCLSAHPDDDNISCRDSMREKNKRCVCTIEFNLTEPLIGPVTVYYELTNLDQTQEDYVNSRDNNQLNGVILEEPSASCDPYRYDVIAGVETPIVPCGAIADSMFNDQYGIATMNETLVTLLDTGMLSPEDKAGFHNPENLQQALQNFTKPKSWAKPIWELDTEYEDNNGFQNEAFISWMRTDWKRKPIARVNHSHPLFLNGLPAGGYEATVQYVYPVSKYDGPRLLILAVTETVVDASARTAGVVLLVIGLLMLTALGLPYAWKYLQDRRNKGSAVALDDNTASPNTAPNETPLVT